MDALEESTSATEDGSFLSRREMTIGSSSLKGKNRDRLHQQIERLQKQLDDVTQQRDAVLGQIEDLFQLRHTDAEQQLVEQKAHYDARLKAQDDTIQQLQDSLSRVDALSRSDGTTSLHFLTRETADEEKQDVQREVIKLKQSIKEKDGVIRGKEIKIKDLDETIKVLRADLKIEIENTKALTSRNTPFGSQHHAKSGEAKNAMAIRLYEELTNLLITNVKHEPGRYKEDDAIYTCVQTTNSGISLNFTLKFFKEAEEGETPSNAGRDGRIIDKVIYSPLLLEKESEEFVTQLGFLASPFVFSKEQMSVFTSTLLKYLEGESEDNQSSSDQMEDN